MESRDEKIRDGCEVYALAPERARGGERTISTDELTGVQALQRKYPDLPMQPDHVLRREFEYIQVSWQTTGREREVSLASETHDQHSKPWLTLDQAWKHLGTL